MELGQLIFTPTLEKCACPKNPPLLIVVVRRTKPLYISWCHCQRGYAGYARLSSGYLVRLFSFSFLDLSSRKKSRAIKTSLPTWLWVDRTTGAPWDVESLVSVSVCWFESHPLWCVMIQCVSVLISVGRVTVEWISRASSIARKFAWWRRSDSDYTYVFRAPEQKG